MAQENFNKQPGKNPSQNPQQKPAAAPLRQDQGVRQGDMARERDLDRSSTIEESGDESI